MNELIGGAVGIVLLVVLVVVLEITIGPHLPEPPDEWTDDDIF